MVVPRLIDRPLKHSFQRAFFAFCRFFTEGGTSMIETDIEIDIEQRMVRLPKDPPQLDRNEEYT